jgi:hypothetical protein
MKTHQTARLAAPIVMAILFGVTIRNLQASPPAPEAQPPAASVASSPPFAAAPEVSASGAFLGALKPSQEIPAAPPLSPEEARDQLQKAIQVESDGPNRFRIGTVGFDRVRRTVTIPAMVNMDSGVIEYALVHEFGKVHEALFATAARPEQINLACVLLGMSKENQGDTTEPAANAVKVKVMWETNGPPAEHDLSQMVVTADNPNVLDHAQPLPIGPWNYVGSKIDGRGFAAARDGSVISLIPDSLALVDNQRESAKRDDCHFPNKALVPPKGSSVNIVLTLPEPAMKH